jgi:putative ABC transport system permease protein
MIGVTLSGILGRKVRGILTAFAVVIGVAMISGTYVLTDTFQKAFDKVFDESYVGTDAVVSGKQLLEFSSSGRAPVPEDVLTAIEALPEVDTAAGGIFDLQSN